MYNRNINSEYDKRTAPYFSRNGYLKKQNGKNDIQITELFCGGHLSTWKGTDTKEVQ